MRSPTTTIAIGRLNLIGTKSAPPSEWSVNGSNPTFFYVLPREMLNEPMIGLRDRFIELAYARISKIKPLFPMSNRPKETGPSYHPLWRQISSNWVSMNGNPDTVALCLETMWNSHRSTPDGYQAVGSSLAAAVSEYLQEREQSTN